MTSNISNLPSQPLSVLLEMRTAVDAEIMARSGGAAAGAAADAKKAKKPKRASQGSAWADFTKMIVQEKVADYTLFKEASESKLGVAPRFVAAYRKEHEAEWLAFQTTWNAAHPKAEKGSVSSAAEEPPSADEGSVTSDSSEKVAKRRGPKKLADMTPEERTAHDAAVEKRRQAKKAPSAAAAAAAAAAAPVVLTPVPLHVHMPSPSPAVSMAPIPSSSPEAEEAEEGGMVERVFTLDGHKYVRIWDEGEKTWDSGDLWIAKAIGGGQYERGDYVGELMEDGSINTDTEEPAFE